MKVIIAEKPSVAKEIAAFLGAKSRLDGYFEGGGFQVTWAFGHLVSLKEPEEYDPILKKWSLATLPIIPSTFELKLVDNPGVSKQFNVIKKLIRSSTEIIAATDAGREGELIFRYILSLSGQEKKDFKRLWLTSLTDEAMKKAFEQLLPGSHYDNLYAAAKCRSESDWIVGLNATRNFTVRYGRGEILWSVGRVQTPVLALIVQKDDEIRNFVSEPFWELKTKYRNTVFKYKGDRFKVEAQAKELLEKIEPHPFKIQKVEGKMEKVAPPFLYDLTDLQRDMNKRHGMSASETLEIAQSLYESKMISYPRTDSKFLGSDMKAEVPKILQQLAPIRQTEIGALDLNALSFTPRVINNQKTGEHHAIIPTGKSSQSLSAFAEKVFNAIVTRFIAAFYPHCVKSVTSVEGSSNDVSFQAKGVQIVDPGWTLLYAKEKEVEDPEKQKDEEQELPVFIKGEEGPHAPFIKQGKTEPPRHFTEGTLLGAMETAGKLVDDEQLKEALKQKGLGTPATRAAIIETLLKRSYIVREKKSLEATDLGRYLIALIQDPSLKSPELTGEWESKLKEVEQGKLQASTFMQEITSYIRELIAKSDSSRINESILGDCPRCKKPIIEGQKGYGCSSWRDGCSFVIWKEYKGVKLTPLHMRHLLQRKILAQPLEIAEGKVILYISEKGSLMEILLDNIKTQKKTTYTPKKFSKKAAVK